MCCTTPMYCNARAFELHNSFLFRDLRRTLCLMANRAPWRELTRTDDLRLAMNIATTIAAMQFDVRLCGRDGALLRNAEPLPGGPYLVLIRPADWPDLHDVLDQIIDEQIEFDARLAARDRKSLRLSRIVMILSSAIVAALAVLGIVEL